MTVEIIIQNKLYDVTDFLDEHPGGGNIIEELNGKDATWDFDEIGHSQDAIELLDMYFVKDIKDNDSKYKIPKLKPKSERKNCIHSFFEYLQSFLNNLL